MRDTIEITSTIENIRGQVDSLLSEKFQTVDEMRSALKIVVGLFGGEVIPCDGGHEIGFFWATTVSGHEIVANPMITKDFVSNEKDWMSMAAELTNYGKEISTAIKVAEAALPSNVQNLNQANEAAIDKKLETSFEWLERLNHVFELTVFLLADSETELCGKFVQELLKLIICITVEMFETAEGSSRAAELEAKIDEGLRQIGSSDSELFKKIQDTKPAMFEQINSMVLGALHQMDEDFGVEVSAVNDNGIDGIGMLKNGEKEGLQLWFDEGSKVPRQIDFWDDGFVKHRLLFNKDGTEIFISHPKEATDGPQLAQTEPKTSVFPAIGAAALLAAAVAIKFTPKHTEKNKAEQAIAGVKNGTKT